MRVLVTGGSGRLGNVLVRRLLDRGAEIHVLVEPGNTRPRSLEGLNVVLHAGSVLDKPSLSAAMKGMDQVFHLAAKIKLEKDRDGSMWAVNVTGTRYVADLCMDLGISRLVHCSSLFALTKEPLDQVVDESRPLSMNDATEYYRSKAHAEKYILQAVQQGLPAVIVNPGSIIGPYDFQPSILGETLLELVRGNLNSLMKGNGNFADVRDIADAMIQAGETGKVGERYILSAHPATWEEIVAIIEEITGQPGPERYISPSTLKMILPLIRIGSKLTGKKPPVTREMINASLVPANVSWKKAKDELDFSPRPLKDSFSDCLGWFQKNGMI